MQLVREFAIIDLFLFLFKYPRVLFFIFISFSLHIIIKGGMNNDYNILFLNIY